MNKEARVRPYSIASAILRTTAAIVIAGAAAGAQGDVQPTNDLPNPYQSIENYFKLPDGRTWGSTSAIEIDKDGRSIWVAERCGTNSCLDRASGQMSPSDPILHFDASGKLIKSFGAGMLIFPHGIFVDKEGNVWVTDGQDNAPVPARGAGGRGRGEPGAARAEQPAAAAGPIGPRPGATKGNQVYKFSPDGKLLLTLGKPGGAASPDYFYQPNDVLVAPNGDIFVSEGHGAGNNRVLKFDKNGKFIKEWGKLGSAPGEFDQPHALAMDSKGRLFVGDRNNNRIQIFDQDGKFIAEWKQFSRPSGVYIDKQDNIYVADSESESVSRNHDGWHRGLRIGSAKDGSVKYFIPDPQTGKRPDFSGTSAAEGVVADSQGNIYGAEVGPHRVMKYTKRVGTK
jgi:streptogramin lyase